MNTVPFYIALTAWGTWALAISAIVALWRQLRTQKQLAGYQFLLEVSHEYNSPNMQAHRKRLAQLLLSGADDPLEESVMEFFGRLGYLTRRGIFDPEMVWTTFSNEVRTYWFSLHDYVYRSRELLGDRTLFGEFEWLDGFLTRIEARHRGQAVAEVTMKVRLRNAVLEDDSHL